MAHARSNYMALLLGEKRHCDEYILDETQPKCLRDFVRLERQPAQLKCHPDYQKPELYATTTAAVINLPPGTPVRVVMASRQGDVGITELLDNQYGYQVRCALEDLENFSCSKPERPISDP